MKSWRILNRQLLHGIKTIPVHFILKIKRNADGSIDKYKARLVAGGHKQLQYMYDHTFAPTANSDSIKLIYSLSAKESLIIRLFDVTGAYLLADLESPVPIYMTIPSFQGNPELLVELKKSLYGLKQAGYLWNQKLDKALKAVNLNPTAADPCIYHYEQGEDRVIVAIHVDDLLFAATSEGIIDQIVAQLKKELDANIEEVTHSGSHLVNNS